MNTSDVRDPYIDKLPNGLFAIRIDSAESVGVSIVALLPLGMMDDAEIVAIQQANANLIVRAFRELR